MIQALDLSAYFDRIGYALVPSLDLATLCGLHLAHASTIPFENLDVQMRRPIQLDLESLQAKLVQRQRGGYCFEQNTLFLSVLNGVGIATTAYEARVRQGSSAVRPRTHMVLVANVGEGDYLCDVGFGGDGPLEPVPMDGTESIQGPDAYRVASDEELHVLQLRRDSDWFDLYAFHRVDANPVDFELSNWFTSTHPRSPFVAHVVAQHRTVQARHILRDLVYVERKGGIETTRTIPRSDLVGLLRTVFRIDIGDDVRLRALDEPSGTEPS